MACGAQRITHALSCGLQPAWEKEHPDFCFAFAQIVSHLSCVSATSHSCSFLSSQVGLELSPIGQRDFGKIGTGGACESPKRQERVLFAFLGEVREKGESVVGNF